MKVYHYRKLITLALTAILAAMLLGMMFQPKETEASGCLNNWPKSIHHSKVIPAVSRMLANNNPSKTRMYAAAGRSAEILMWTSVGCGKYALAVFRETKPGSNKFRMVTNYIVKNKNVGMMTPIRKHGLKKVVNVGWKTLRKRGFDILIKSKKPVGGMFVVPVEDMMMKCSRVQSFYNSATKGHTKEYNQWLWKQTLNSSCSYRPKRLGPTKQIKFKKWIKMQHEH